MNKGRDDEQRLEDIIRQSYEDVDIPEGIEPDNIEIVREGNAAYDEEDVPLYDAGDPVSGCARPKTLLRIAAGIAGAAAVAACVILTGIFDGNIGIGNNEASDDKVIDVADTGSSETVKDNYNANDDAEASFAGAGSYEEIFEKLESGRKMYYDYVVKEDVAMDDVATSGEAASADGSLSFNAGNNIQAEAPKDFSDTNVQVEGVDEADIIKTDGEYIITLKSYTDEINITKADNGKLERVSGFYIEEEKGNNIVPVNMYMCDDKLVILAYTDKYEEDEYESYVSVITYDIKDRYNPVYTGSVNMDGSYVDSRCVGGYVYVFTSFYPTYYGTIDSKDYDKYVPSVDGRLIECSDINIPEEDSFDSYMVMMSVDINGGKKADEYRANDKKAVLACGGTMYVSNNSIYIMSGMSTNNNIGYKRYTSITKLDYADGKIDYVACKKIDGYVDSQFSADEYNGNLRLVTTHDSYNHVSGRSNQFNSLYVLDDKLNVIGSIEKLAKGERIYSARFYGDYAYFVTFYQTDPLFTADVSDPYNPKIVSEIKLPGFSDYLQGFGEDRLFGIGYNVNEISETYIKDNIKMTMFNISDKENVAEEDTLIIKDSIESSACYNHKALLINYDKKIIGFDVNFAKKEKYYTQYMLYTYEDGFKKLCSYDFYKNFDGESAGFNSFPRGIFIGEYLYIIDGNVGIASYKIGDDRLVDKLKL